MIKKLLIVIMIVCFSVNVKASEKEDNLPDFMTVRRAYNINQAYNRKQKEYLYLYNSLSNFTRGYTAASYKFIQIFISIKAEQNEVCLTRGPGLILSSIFRKFEDGKIDGNNLFIDELNKEIGRCID